MLCVYILILKCKIILKSNINFFNYPLLKWLVKNFIFTKNVTAEQDSFDVYLNKVIVHIEIVFGQLENRFRRLLKQTDSDIGFIP